MNSYFTDIYVTGVEIGIRNLRSGSGVASKGNRLGMLADVQVSQHDYCTCAKAFPA